MTRRLTWSYGVTTVLSRRNTLLPRTLLSLKKAGFDNPHLFIDGDNDGKSWEKDFNLSVTCRNPNVRTAGHWVLSLYELYYRHQSADRFALFQDDLVTYYGLRQYLDGCPYPEKGYLNLFTFPSNFNLANGRQGWYPSNQFGRGAVALVFSQEAVMGLLQSKHLVHRVQDVHRGYRAIDGGVVDSMKERGYKEYVHNPSLTYHTGDVSSMLNAPHAQTINFNGENYDISNLKPQLHE